MQSAFHPIVQKRKWHTLIIPFLYPLSGDYVRKLAYLEVSLLNKIPIGQQYWIQSFISFNAASIFCHNIWTIL